MKNLFKKTLLVLVAILLSFGSLNVSANGMRVVIDAGHGGKDPGATANGLKEKDLTLNISRKINQYLQKNYIVETKMTRNSDVYLSLKERTDMANNWGSDLFLSIHINAGGGTGYEDYVHSTVSSTSETREIQREINKEVNKVLEEYKKKNRGQKKANFHVLRETKKSAVLLEILFIDNKTDAELLKNERFLNDISEAIAIGVAHALDLPKRVSSKPSVESKPIKINVTKSSGNYVVTASSLNVREGNGTSYKSIGYVKKNDVIKVTGKTSNNWYQFTHNGKVGYVSGSYLKKKSTSTSKKPSSSISVSKASGTYQVTANDGLNIRTGNGTKYKSVGKLEKGKKIKINGKTSNGWYRFNYNGKNRYVSGSYLKKVKTTSKSTVTKASGKYKVTAKKALNVRTGAGSKYKKIGSLKRGKVITVNGKKGNWYRFNYNGKNRYVRGSYLKKVK